jgi:hypothetical protein
LKNFKIHDKLEKGIFVELYKGNYMTLTLKELREFMEQIPKDTTDKNKNRKGGNEELFKIAKICKDHL